MNFDTPYPARRVPVFARNVVATSQPLAAQAGLRMLAQGGNAIDAALAAAITLTVVEPTGNRCWQRCLRHSLGWRRVARAERVGPVAGRMG